MSLSKISMFLFKIFMYPGFHVPVKRDNMKMSSRSS